MTEYRLGRLAGLNLSARPSAVAGTIVLWAILAALGAALLDLPVGTAIVASLAAVALHWGSELLHQLGHAWAARRVGYPMIGVRAWGVLSASIYPPDEPALPGRIHIRRALGGPLASLLVTVVAGALALALRPLGGAIWWLALFFCLENLLVFTLGSLLPLGFNDGSTLLHWWGK
jgi:Zn-dependent protease